MRKRIKSLGVLTGVRDLLLAGDKVATVRYRIQQDQEVLIADAIDGSREELDGLRETHGTVTVVDGRIDLETYTLRMADGRELDVIVTNMGWPGSPCPVQGSGEIR
ncbi:MAG: hypothetical protein AB7N24_11550 [Dehalococcoidia bacterium]